MQFLWVLKALPVLSGIPGALQGPVCEGTSHKRQTKLESGDRTAGKPTTKIHTSGISPLSYRVLTVGKKLAARHRVHLGDENAVVPRRHIKVVCEDNAKTSRQRRAAKAKQHAGDKEMPPNGPAVIRPEKITIHKSSRLTRERIGQIWPVRFVREDSMRTKTKGGGPEGYGAHRDEVTTLQLNQNFQPNITTHTVKDCLSCELEERNGEGHLMCKVRQRDGPSRTQRQHRMRQGQRKRLVRKIDPIRKEGHD